MQREAVLEIFFTDSLLDVSVKQIINLVFM